MRDRYPRLEVTARMAEPIVTYGSQVDQITLDGLLAWALMMEGGGPQPMGDWPLDYDLPLERWTRPYPPGEADPRLFVAGLAEVWGWCSSPAWYEALNHGQMAVRRRPAVQQMRDWTEDATVQTSMGRYKGKDLAYPTVYARELRWVLLGDPSEVRRLLQSCSGIGKLRHHGNGAVDAWSVVERAEGPDWSRGRMLPDPGGVLRGIRPPYWHPSRQVRCAPQP